MRDWPRGPALRVNQALLLCVALSSLSCAVRSPGLGYVGGWDRNISDETPRWAGYKQEAVYETAVDLFLINIPDRTNGLALVPDVDARVPPGSVRGPITIERYHEETRNWARIRGVVGTGTRVRATTLRSKGNMRAPRLTRDYVKGRILRGPFQGELIDLEPVSVYRTDADNEQAVLLGPNEDFLRRI